MKKWVAGMVLMSLLILSAFPAEAREPSDQREFRAFWVDAFHDGIKTPEQVDKLIADAQRANVNALIVQVRRRGDAYFNRALEPRTEDPALQPGFDALQYLIDKAHSASPRIEVHAWLATLPIWNSATPPQSPGHVFNRHGPSAAGRDYWLMTRVDGAERSGNDYVLDPGHPDAVEYTVEQYLNVVREYDVDGIHLDLVRYMGVDWGYNPTSLERYRAETGAVGTPDPQDEQWKQWRREQVTNLMRQVYLRSIAIRPDIKVSVAVIAWGEGPTSEEEYRRSAPMQQVMQDWNAWLSEGIIDMVIPMNYDREHDPNQKLWYDQWIAWEKDHQYERQIAIGPGAYLNSVSGTLSQIRRAQAPSPNGNRAAGVSIYSYAETNKDGISNDQFYASLSGSNPYGDPAFPEWVDVPDMPWKSDPQRGFLMGKVKKASGDPAGGVKVKLRGPKGVLRETRTDGNGFFGFADLLPGSYVLQVDKQAAVARGIPVKAGSVAEVQLKTDR